MLYTWNEYYKSNILQERKKKKKKSEVYKCIIIIHHILDYKELWLPFKSKMWQISSE